MLSKMKPTNVQNTSTRLIHPTTLSGLTNEPTSGNDRDSTTSRVSQALSRLNPAASTTMVAAIPSRATEPEFTPDVIARIINEMEEDKLNYEELDEKCQCNPDIAIAAVKKDCWNLAYVPTSIPQRRAIVELALKSNGCTLAYASLGERDEYALVSLALKNFDQVDSAENCYGTPLSYASHRLQEDDDLFDMAYLSQDADSSDLFRDLTVINRDRISVAINALGCDVLNTLSHHQNTVNDNEIYDLVERQYANDSEYELADLVPDSFFDKRERLISMLRRDAKIITKLPMEVVDADLVDLALNEGYPLAAYFGSFSFKSNLRNIIKYEVYDVPPDSIIIPENITLEELKDAITKAPTQIATFLYEYALSKHNVSIDLDSQAISLSKYLALKGVNKKHVAHAKGAEKRELITHIYPGDRSLVKCHNSRYIVEMKDQLTEVGINTYSTDQLFSEESCLPLFDENNRNSVLFVSQEDMTRFGSGLNGLLESGTWMVGDTVSKIVTKIVVVGKPESLSPDIRSRLQSHVDVKSRLLSHEKPEISINIIEQSPVTSIKVEEVEYADELLSKQYRTVKDVYALIDSGRSINLKQGPPIIASSHEELSYLERHLRRFGHEPPGMAYMPSLFPVTSDVVNDLPEMNTGEKHWVLLDSVTNIDDLVDSYIMKSESGIVPNDADTLKSLFSEARIYVNSLNNPDLCAAVYKDTKGVPHLNYKGCSYPVRSLHASMLSVEEVSLAISDRHVRLLDQKEKDRLTMYYHRTELETENKVAQKILDSLLGFFSSDRTLQLIEGAPAIGKDELSSHFAKQFKSLKYRSVHYQHFTAGFDLSLLSETVRLRKAHPEKLLVIHISEGNLCSLKGWEDLKMWMYQDLGVKIVATQNPLSTGDRFDLSDLCPSSQVLKLLESERESMEDSEDTAYAIYRLAGGEYDLSADMISKVSSLHLSIKRQAGGNVTNRQLESLFGILTTKDHKNPIDFYEAVQRVYGDYIEPGNALGLGQLLEQSHVKDISSHRYNAIQASEMSGSYYDDRDSHPKKLWLGNNANFLSRYHSRKLQLHYGSEGENRTAITKLIQPGDSIDLGSFPGQRKLNYQVLYNGQVIDPLQVESMIVADNKALEGKRFIFKNNFSKPVKVALYGQPSPKKLSAMQDFSVTKDLLLHLSPEEMMFIEALIAEEDKRSTSSDDSDTITLNQKKLSDYELVNYPSSTQITRLAEVLGLQNTNDPKQVVKDLFRRFNGFIDCGLKGFDNKPDVNPELPEKYVHLMHSYLSSHGVCRQQAPLMHTLLKVFGINSTVHVNECHEYITLEDNTIVDVGYFTSVLMKAKYDELLKSHKDLTSIKSHLSVDVQRHLLVDLERVQAILDYPHAPGVSPQTLVEWIERLQAYLPSNSNSLEFVYKTERGELEPKQIVNSASRKRKIKPSPQYRLARHRLESELTRRVETVEPKTSKIKSLNKIPKDLIDELYAGKLSEKVLLQALRQTKSLGYRPWIDVLETYLNRSVDVPPAKRHKLETSIRQPFRESPMASKMEKLILGVLSKCLLESLPKNKQTFRGYYPKVADAKLPARGLSLGSAYLVSMTKPAPELNHPITLELPMQFKKPFVLFTSSQAMMIDSPKHLERARHEAMLLELSTDVKTKLLATLNNILGGRAKISALD